MNYYISDLHFNHQNAIMFDKRLKSDGTFFTDVEEMNEYLIQRWNEVVTDSDNVYVLGDIFMGKYSLAQPILERLNGKIHLIRGNHDKINLLTKKIVQIVDYLEIHDSGYDVILCHYPIPMYKQAYREDVVMLYGHVHQTREEDFLQLLRYSLQKSSSESYGNNKGQFFNVGCMMPYMDYTPRTLLEILGENKIPNKPIV